MESLGKKNNEQEEMGDREVSTGRLIYVAKK